ncbi:MAG: fused vitamin K epoxide reductase/thioredoxin, partial [Chitinophagaceae bacterium]
MEKSSSKKSFYWLAVIATIAFIGVQLYLNKHHVDLKLGLGSGPSACNVSETMNCDTAATSTYAELFGVPMALLGAMMGGLLLIFIMLARFNLTADTDRTERIAFYIASFMVVVSVVMGLISFFILRSGCPFCIASYVLSALIWIGLYLAYRPKTGMIVNDVQDMFTGEKWILASLITVPVLAFLVNNMTLDSYGYQEMKRVTQDSMNN